MKVTLLVFTLNEIEGMKQIMPRVKKEWIDQIRKSISAKSLLLNNNQNEHLNKLLQ